MAKKKQEKKRDYLKLTIITVAVISLVVSLFAFWDGYNLINTLSTVFTMLGVALTPVLILFMFVFWLKMLVDSFQKQRWLWLVAISIGALPFALLYLYIKKPKLTSFRPTAWIALGVFVIMWGPLAFQSLWDRFNQVDLSTLQPTGRQFEAKVVTNDLRGYKFEGPTICTEVKSGNDTYYTSIKGGTVTVSDKSDAKLNYRLEFYGEVSGETSGWQEFREAEPEKIKYVDVPDLIGGSPSEINGRLTGCTIELWSSE